MIEIDGSQLEGGGQLLRGAVALSALLGEPVTITNIRKRRTNPGLAAQHIAAVKAVAGICDAEYTGLVPRSTELTFIPGEPHPHETRIDIGTAGSIALVLQAWLPVALTCGGRIHLTGGTEVGFSPTIDYFDRLFCDTLRRSNADITLSVLRRGYYPRGGGEVVAEVRPCPMNPVDLVACPPSGSGIISCSSRLPPHVAERQASAAVEALEPYLGEVPVSIEQREDPSTGSSLTAWAGAKGGSDLGRRGYPAEEVGHEAARRLLEALNEPGIVDVHLADQLLIPVARYGGRFTTARLSLHARTVCWLLDRFCCPVETDACEGGGLEVRA